MVKEYSELVTHFLLYSASFPVTPGMEKKKKNDRGHESVQLFSLITKIIGLTIIFLVFTVFVFLR